MTLTDDQRAELVAIINREGGAPGNSLHAWRCEDKDRYPEPCGCVEGVVDELAQAIESWPSSPPEGWEERIDRLHYVNVQGHEVLMPALFPEFATHKRRIWTEPLREVDA